MRRMPHRSCVNKEVIMTYTEWTLSGMLFLGILFCFAFVPVGVILIGITFLLGAYALRKTEADPPTLAILEFLGKPQEILIQPRYILVLEPFEELILLPGGQIV